MALLKVLKWFWKGWPILTLLLLLIVHQAISNFSLYELMNFENIQQFDKFLSFLLNIIGGLLVLYSVDSNLGLFRKEGMFKLFVNWLKSFPLLKPKPLENKATSVNSVSAVGKIRIENQKTPTTLDELFEFTQKQINYLKEDIEYQNQQTNKKFEILTRELSSKNQEIDKSISEINNQLTTVVIGGFKTQLFGVLLVLYGSYLSYVA
jgi:hypothetical protein